jgi:hypothetical protein
MNRRPVKNIDPAATLKNFNRNHAQTREQRSVSQEAEALRQLEDVRNKLFSVISVDFKKELVRIDPPEIRTGADAQNKSMLMENINALAIDLNHKSMSEGAQVLATAALNCILLLKEEINKQAFQNYTLKKQIEDLKKEVDLLKPKTNVE